MDNYLRPRDQVSDLVDSKLLENFPSILQSSILDVINVVITTNYDDNVVTMWQYDDIGDKDNGNYDEVMIVMEWQKQNMLKGVARRRMEMMIWRMAYGDILYKQQIWMK